MLTAYLSSLIRDRMHYYNNQHAFHDRRGYQQYNHRHHQISQGAKLSPERFSYADISIHRQKWTATVEGDLSARSLFRRTS